MKTKELECKIVFSCYCWEFLFHIFFSSFAWIVEVGGKIHWNAKVYKSHVYIDEKFVTLPLYIHRRFLFYIYFWRKKDTVFVQRPLNGNIYALIYSSNCNDIHWFRYVFFTSHRMNRNTKIPNEMTTKRQTKQNQNIDIRYNDTDCTATNIECKLSQFILK